MRSRRSSQSDDEYDGSEWEDVRYEDRLHDRDKNHRERKRGWTSDEEPEDK